MVAELIERSNRYLDAGVIDGEYNPMTLSCTSSPTGWRWSRASPTSWRSTPATGSSCFDTSLGRLAPGASGGAADVADEPVHTLVYTHGHVDHVGGRAGVPRTRRPSAGDRRPDVVGHANVAARFDRYELTDGYNAVINARQFGGTGRCTGRHRRRRPAAADWVRPIGRPTATGSTWRSATSTSSCTTARARPTTTPGRGSRRTGPPCVGDFLIWVFPNAGNPQKVQRYPREWAGALRADRGAQTRAAAAGPRPADRRARAHPDGARRRGRAALELLVDAGARAHERGRPPRRHRPRGAGARRPGRPPVAAAALRRARVRGPQHLAPLRRLVRRQPGPPQAAARRRHRGRDRRGWPVASTVLVRPSARELADADEATSAWPATWSSWPSRPRPTTPPSTRPGRGLRPPPHRPRPRSWPRASSATPSAPSSPTRRGQPPSGCVSVGHGREDSKRNWGQRGSRGGDEVDELLDRADQRGLEVGVAA